MRNLYDIAIIGGGPAGSVLASQLNKKYRTIILDRRDLSRPEPQGFQKVCGGLLAPDAQKELSRLGWGLPDSILQGPQLFGVRTMDLDSHKEQYYQRYYYNMNREAFDRWLFSKIPASVDTHLGDPVTGIEQRVDQWTLRLKSGTYFRSRIVIGAEGAASMVRRKLRAPSPRRYRTIQEWVEPDQDHSCFGVLFDSSISDFYGWTIPKGNALILGVALKEGADTMDRFELFKQRLREQGYQWGRTIKRESAAVLRPRNLGEVTCGRGNLALIGEAAGWISPSSAEGISYAIRSARALSDALEPSMEGYLSRYRKNSRSLGVNLLGKWAKSPGMYWPPLRSMVLGSALGAMSEVQNPPIIIKGLTRPA